jgi:hypothetical protein
MSNQKVFLKSHKLFKDKTTLNKEAYLLFDIKKLLFFAYIHPGAGQNTQHTGENITIQ